jgi:hypothetical protein
VIKQILISFIFSLAAFAAFANPSGELSAGIYDTKDPNKVIVELCRDRGTPAQSCAAVVIDRKLLENDEAMRQLGAFLAKQLK